MKTVTYGHRFAVYLSPDEVQALIMALSGQPPMDDMRRNLEAEYTYWSNLPACLRDSALNHDMEKSVTKACQGCGKLFFPQRPDAKCCSPTCRKKAARQRRKDV